MTRRTMSDATTAATRGVVAAGIAAVLALLLATLAARGYREAPPLAPLEPGGLALHETPEREVRAEPVSVPVAGAERDAVLYRPVGASPVAAVVLAQGAGRGSAQAMEPLATSLAEGGLAVLVVEKVQPGYGWIHRDYDALADNLVAAAAWLAEQPGVDPDRVGVGGYSEGGWVAATAAALPAGAAGAHVHRAAFLLLMAPAIVTPGEQAAWLVDSRLPSGAGLLRRTVATVASSGAYLLDYHGYDTDAALASLDVPVLAVWGSADLAVPVAGAAQRLLALVPDAAVLVLEGQDHDLAPGPWSRSVGAWLAQPRSGVGGVEPSTLAGVPQLPTPQWFMRPQLHVVVTTLIGVCVAIGNWRRARRSAVAREAQRSI